MTTNEETRDTALAMGRQQGEAAPEAPEAPKPAEARTAPEAQEAPGARAAEPAAAPRPRSERASRRLPDDAGRGFRSQWQEIQADFVDDPRGAVDRAESLVAEVMRRQAEASGQSTEELRVALQRYRSFLDDLLQL